MRVIVFLIVVVLGGFLWGKLQDQATANRAAYAEADGIRLAALNERLSKVKLEKVAWGKGGFDNVMVADFTIRNTGDIPVKDVVISCDHTGNSGTEIGNSTKTVYERIDAKAAKTIRRFNMGLINTQVARSSCRVTDFSND